MVCKSEDQRASLGSGRMMSMLRFTKYLDDQRNPWNQQNFGDIPLYDHGEHIEGFAETGMFPVLQDYRDAAVESFDYTLSRLAGWLLGAKGYAEMDEVGCAMGVVEVQRMPKVEYIPEILQHPRIRFEVVGRN